MIWKATTVATKVITLVITPAAGQRVCIKHIVGLATAGITLSGSTTTPCQITATPIDCFGGTYTFRDCGVGNTVASQISVRSEWMCADPNDPETWLRGAAGQAVTLTYDGSNIGTWTDGDNGLLQVFGILDGRAGGVATVIAGV